MSLCLQALRFSTTAKYTNCMADDTPQDTTTTQDTSAIDQPKVEEVPTETPPTETQTEETKTEPAFENPTPAEVSTQVGQTPEPTKEEEKKPLEEPKTEEKPKEEIKPDPEKPQPPQINLNELRDKANKERQDRKQEHLSEVEKLAKSKQINNDDVRELLNVSQSTATNYLEELTKQGKIKKSGKAKATTYSS